jgi:hypothetical protein
MLKEEECSTEWLEIKPFSIPLLLSATRSIPMFNKYCHIKQESGFHVHISLVEWLDT